MGCNNLCIRYKVKQNGRSSEYIEGKKYCSKCECYFIQQDRQCKCCGNTLRTRAHYKRNHINYKLATLARRITIYPLVKK